MNPLPGPDARRATLQVLAVMLLALAVRAWLAPRYFGWEEGDYGNLMMIREVIDSKFTWFRTAHMPGWYTLGAVARLLAGDAARLPALWMTMLASVTGVGIATALARSVAGGAAGWLTGLWLAVQPEMALYGASTLRSPVYAMLGLLGLWLLLRGRPLGFVATAGAFLVRMEAFFVFFGPALATWGPARGRSWRSLLPGLLVLASVVVSWQGYIAIAQGEAGPFWAGPLGQNQAGGFSAEFIESGLASVWHLLTWTLPRKLSWPCLVLAGIGATAALTGFGRPGSRPIAAYACLTLGFWLAEGFLSQQDPNHNLYWVWLVPAIPPLVLLAAVGWAWTAERLVALPRAARPALLAVVILSAAPTFAHEADYQLSRSEQWYRPQLDLARWLEDNARPGAGMVLGSIPEVWVQRKAHSFRVTSWWFLPQSLKGQPPESFGDFVASQNVDYVMWFAEEWTEAPAIAPFLAEGVAVDLGAARLVPVGREDGYGWILYVVERPGVAAPPRPLRSARITGAEAGAHERSGQGRRSGSLARRPRPSGRLAESSSSDMAQPGRAEPGRASRGRRGHRRCPRRRPRRDPGVSRDPRKRTGARHHRATPAAGTRRGRRRTGPTEPHPPQRGLCMLPLRTVGAGRTRGRRAEPLPLVPALGACRRHGSRGPRVDVRRPDAATGVRHHLGALGASAMCTLRARAQEPTASGVGSGSRRRRPFAPRGS